MWFIENDLWPAFLNKILYFELVTSSLQNSLVKKKKPHTKEEVHAQLGQHNS